MYASETSHIHTESGENDCESENHEHGVNTGISAVSYGLRSLYFSSGAVVVNDDGTDIPCVHPEWESDYTCAVCGIPCMHESYDDEGSNPEANCEGVGTHHYKCSVCGKPEQKPEAALGHEWKNGICQRENCGKVCVHEWKLDTYGSSYMETEWRQM